MATDERLLATEDDGIKHVRDSATEIAIAKSLLGLIAYSLQRQYSDYSYQPPNGAELVAVILTEEERDQVVEDFPHMAFTPRQLKTPREIRLRSALEYAAAERLKEVVETLGEIASQDVTSQES